MKLKILKLVNLLFYNNCFFISKTGFYNCFTGIQLGEHNSKNYFLISEPKHIVWVHKIEHQKHIFKLVNKKIVTFLCLYFLDICFSSF